MRASCWVYGGRSIDHAGSRSICSDPASNLSPNRLHRHGLPHAEAGDLRRKVVAPRPNGEPGTGLYLLGLMAATTDIALKKIQAYLRDEEGVAGRGPHAVALFPGPGPATHLDSCESDG